MKFNNIYKKIEDKIQFSETNVIKFEEKVDISWLLLCESTDENLKILENYYNENKIYLGYISNKSENCRKCHEKEKWYLEFEIKLFSKKKKQRIHLFHKLENQNLKKIRKKLN
jgi:hypothetical protein